MQFIFRIAPRKSLDTKELEFSVVVFGASKLMLSTSFGVLSRAHLRKSAASSCFSRRLLLWHGDVLMHNPKRAFSTTQENLCDTGI
jgi:hypothetical protein